MLPRFAIGGSVIVSLAAFVTESMLQRTHFHGIGAINQHITYDLSLHFVHLLS